jgi:hypothetical protein
VEAPGPRIERAVADQLAELSDELAGSLETGDSCAASQTAARLRDSVTQAINDGKVPELYLEDLSGLANELQAQVPECVAAPPPPVEDDGDDEKKNKKKKKKEDKDKGKDKEKDRDDGDEDETENIPTEPDLIPTVPETETTEPTTTATTTGSEEER